MSYVNQCGVANNPGADKAKLFKVLMMGEDDQGLSLWEKFLGVHGCLVQVCHSYIEFLLYLEHEPFNLLVIFESKNQPDSQACLSYLNESHKRTPLIVVNREKHGGWPNPNRGYLN